MLIVKIPSAIGHCLMATSHVTKMQHCRRSTWLPWWWYLCGISCVCGPLKPNPVQVSLLCQPEVRTISGWRCRAGGDCVRYVESLTQRRGPVLSTSRFRFNSFLYPCVWFKWLVLDDPRKSPIVDVWTRPDVATNFGHRLLASNHRRPIIIPAEGPREA